MQEKEARRLLDRVFQGVHGAYDVALFFLTGMDKDTQDANGIIKKFMSIIAHIEHEKARGNAVSQEAADECGYLHDKILAAMTGQNEPTAWVVANGKSGEDERFLCMDVLIDWTPDIQKALWFYRKQDAEAFARDDEDAWRIIPVQDHIVDANKMVTSEIPKNLDNIPKTDDYEKTFNEFWAKIVLDGPYWNHDKVKRELHDYAQMMHEVQKVFCHVTGNNISIPNTLARCVIAEADRHYEEMYKDQCEECDYKTGRRGHEADDSNS